MPYLRDRGDGLVTEVNISGCTIDLVSGDEHLQVLLDADVERTLHLPFGYESRYGLLGLVRLDTVAAGPVRYTVRRVA